MITIGKITYDDLDDLAILYEELSGTKTNLQKFNKNFDWINSNKDYLLIGAKDDNGNLVGSLLGIVCKDLVGECKPFLVIENVIVKSDYRKMGIGKGLMNFIEEFARTRNCYFTMLVSAFSRKNAHKFYESIGYAKDVVRGFKKYL
ncbi:GNAT family N-acetyltransferase [Clostridium lundense]|uniref:GNAT family N-acetyltransferase n=1 Tax=Clostridium lundense TaxID=319475 RepID=UPI000481E436|nr:GNAT family N-acetyltransferase [Clostridium lundense]